MEYKVLGKSISGPFAIPSGIVITEIQTLMKIAREIPEVGILTTKSISLDPIEGNKEPIIAGYEGLSFINAVGLRNKGVDSFVEGLASVKIPEDKFLLASILGESGDEFKEVAERLYPYVDGFELNISCPNSVKYGKKVGGRIDIVEKTVKSVSSLGKPVFVKLYPGSDIECIVGRCVRSGAAGITAINTLGPKLFLHDGYPVLSSGVGGLSGKAIFELGLRCVERVRAVTDLPIIACGGISTAEDVRKYRKAGANYFGIGSALAGMSTGDMREYFHMLSLDLEEGTNNAVAFLNEHLNMSYTKYTVENKKVLAEDLFVLEFDDILPSKPGQFIFVWLPEKGEKPFSVLDDDPLTLLIQKRGFFTNVLSRLSIGDTVYVRGPYGNSPNVDGDILLVGGGTGIAALYLFAKYGRSSVGVLGARDKDHLCYEIFKDVCDELYLYTEDGSVGRRGLVTDGLEELLLGGDFDYCINCGPEPMVRSAVEIQQKYVNREHIFSSIEYKTMCGIGLCGSCATSKGFRSCVDGTFLRPYQF